MDVNVVKYHLNSHCRHVPPLVGIFAPVNLSHWHCCLISVIDCHPILLQDPQFKYLFMGRHLELHHTLIPYGLFLLQDTQFLLTGGFEKILRVYDLNRPEAPPREVDKSPGSVRTVSWLHSDRTILSSCSDLVGIRYVDRFDTCFPCFT